MPNLNIPLSDLQRPELLIRHEETIKEAFLTTPENPDIYIVWAVCQMYRGNYEEALKYAKTGIGFDPSFVGHYTTLAAIYSAMGDGEKAFEVLSDAYEKSQSIPSLNWNFALGLLERRIWSLGWDLFRWRKVHLPGHVRTLIPEWNKDTPVKPNSTLLIWCEQGLGDITMMFRYVKEIKAKFGFAQVMLEVPAELYNLFSRHADGVDQMYIRRADFYCPYQYDYHCSIMDLPFSLVDEDGKWDVDGSPYLSPLELSETQWKATFAENKLVGDNIGICWYGSQGHVNNVKRSSSLLDFEPVFELGNVFAVQKDNYDLPEFDKPVGCTLLDTSQGIPNADFTSGLLAALDYVVTIDSFVAHLAGSLGVKTFLILPAVSEWRWHGGEGKSSWYDSVEMFKQDTPGDWSGPIARVCNAIKQDQINRKVSKENVIHSLAGSD